MVKDYCFVGDIPVVLWGEDASDLFVAVHGDLSFKEDKIIEVFAREAVSRGYRVLSFDLPEHGDRKGTGRLCNPWNCAEDLRAILDSSFCRSKNIGLFGCSIGLILG